MKIRTIITEAEQNTAKKKIDQYLSQLSDKDLVSLLPLLKESLSESAKDMMQQKKEGKRVDGLPSDFIAYDDTNKTAKRYRERPSGLEVTDAPYRPGPVVQQAVPAPQPVQQMVQQLEKPEAEALANVVANELSNRRAGKKQSSNTESNPALLKKILTALLAGGLLASAYGLGTMSAGDNSAELAKINQLQATIQKYEQSDLPNADTKIKELEKQIQTIQSTLDTTTADFDKERSDFKSKIQDLEKQSEVEKAKQQARADIEAEYKAQRDAERKAEQEKADKEASDAKAKSEERALKFKPIEQALNALSQQLYDPDAKYRNLMIIKLDNGKTLVGGEVNAQNRMGGYVGWTWFAYTPDGLPAAPGQMLGRLMSQPLKNPGGIIYDQKMDYGTIGHANSALAPYIIYSQPDQYEKKKKDVDKVLDRTGYPVELTVFRNLDSDPKNIDLPIVNEDLNLVKKLAGLS